MDTTKHFDEWNEVKKDVHNFGRCAAIKEGEVWWCAMGENVGVEINGKGDRFMRPVLVYKKLSHLGFLGIPLTSQKHEGDWYVAFEFRGKKQLAVLAQVKMFSVLRAYRRMGTLPKSDFGFVVRGFNKLYGVQ